MVKSNVNNIAKVQPLDIDLRTLGNTRLSTNPHNYWLDRRLLELDYRTTGNTDVFALLDNRGHYCIDVTQEQPTLVLFANKIDAFLAKDIVNASQQLHYAVYNCRSDKHPRINNYAVGQILFSVMHHSVAALKDLHCMVCVGYLQQRFNGKQHFVSRHHDDFPDACFTLTDNEVLLYGFALRDYFSALFTAYEADDDIIKTMIAKLSSLNLLTDEPQLKQRANTLHQFLTNNIRTFNSTLPFGPQVVL